MKILYFVLGNPYTRMFKGRESSFDILFENDIVFFGPSTEEHFSFKNRVYPIIQLTEVTCVKTLFGLLPSDWYPDVVIVETPVLNYIPDFYTCPVMTLCLSRDAWGEMIYNHDVAKMFDFVVYQTIDINSYKGSDFSFIPSMGGPISYPVQDDKPIGWKEREIDILAIANYDNGMYHERYKLFCEIAKDLGSDYNVKFITGIEYDGIHRYYRKSRIVVDWSNVLSSRSYEAIINGCVFFSFKDNLLISSVWEEDIEYVAYDYNTILEKLKYYLNSEESSIEVIENGKRKYESLPHSYGERTMRFIKICSEKRERTEQKSEKIKAMTASEVVAATASTLYFNYQYPGHNHPGNWKDLYFERIEKALVQECPIEARRRQLVEAARMSYLLKKWDRLDQYASRLEETGLDYPWIQLLRAKAFYERSDYANSHVCAERALSSHARDGDLVRKLVLPGIERDNACDARRVLDFMWQSVYRHGNEFQANAFLCEAYALLGRLSERNGQKQDAVRFYVSSIGQVPIPENGYAAFKLLDEARDYGELIRLAHAVLLENPYDFLSTLYLSYALLLTGEKPGSVRNLKEQQRIVNAFSSKERILNKTNFRKVVIAGFIGIHFLPRRLTARVIKAFIEKTGNRVR